LAALIRLGVNVKALENRRLVSDILEWQEVRNNPCLAQSLPAIGFSPLLQGDQGDKTITLLNTANLEVIALDQNGGELG
jgi:hypothetical protein